MFATTHLAISIELSKINFVPYLAPCMKSAVFDMGDKKDINFVVQKKLRENIQSYWRDTYRL